MTDQLGLFHPRPIAIQWVDIPADVREQTLVLLARLLRQHYRRILIVPPAQEVRDE
ncbi:MAG TPA: hypothetical protein VHM88_12420 [Candidatus Acidoferrales bacterium]|nr:hypothetical protein [Candidatus Acidoferrales bacterium]